MSPLLRSNLLHKARIYRAGIINTKLYVNNTNTVHRFDASPTNFGCMHASTFYLHNFMVVSSTTIRDLSDFEELFSSASSELFVAVALSQRIKIETASIPTAESAEFRDRP